MLSLPPNNKMEGLGHYEPLSWLVAACDAASIASQAAAHATQASGGTLTWSVTMLGGDLGVVY